MTDIKKIYGKYVFNDKAMKKYIPKETYEKFKKIINDQKELPDNMSKIIAKAMCDWAIDNGATHYTHWFQPLTNMSAEKRESFISFNDKNEIMLKLSGKELIKGESDASSFPSGGIRATFEARGYTAWDISSPAFIKKDETGATLYIPTVFYSYTGEALDKKTLLLRSMDVLNKEAIKLIRLFGNKTSKKVISMLGPEQEYFLINRDLYLKRKDLIYTGRTLFGALPPKGQELDDHYYGTIQSCIGAFMDEVNLKLWELGVPAKTCHNEVAPAQHELAVIYEEANISCDHNQLVMETLKKVANNYNLVCLLHEKPFYNLNGSGKHNNWSIVTDDNINLLSTLDASTDLQFLLIMALIIKAVDENADILRSSAANVGNDYRLGGNEAPPCIISIFLGEYLTNIFEDLVKNKKIDKNKQKGKAIISTGLTNIPDLYKDTTDRNRTSPLAFTGNKFEFRMVGSSDSCAMPITTINTIVAKAFREANTHFENIKTNSKKEFEEEVISYIIKIFNEHKKIIFNGNGYSKDWLNEAKEKNLPNINNMVSAIQALKTEKSESLFTSMNVMTKTELKSRIQIEFETYIKTIRIEAKTMIDMVKKQILPACIAYIERISKTINEINSNVLQIEPTAENEILRELVFNVNNLKLSLDELEKKLNSAEKENDIDKKSISFRDNLIPAMNNVRKNVDILEMLVGKDYWPIPSYGDLVFEVAPL